MNIYENCLICGCILQEFTEPSMNIGKGFKDVSVSNLEELYSVVDGKSWNEWYIF